MATVYATLDASNSPSQIEPGVPFSTYHVMVADEQEAAWSGIAIGDVAPFEVSHPWSFLDSASPAILARYCIQAVTIADPPAGQLLQGYTLTADSQGVITATPTYVNAPPPPRREIPKLTVQQRLKAMGKLSAAWSALQADPDKFGRWFLEGLNVYADDADLLAMLTAIGCTADEVSQITA